MSAIKNNDYNEAIILAGGFGSRLSHIISDQPKSMVMIAGRPFLEWLLLQLKQQGMERVVLAVGYLSEQIESYFQDGANFGLDIVYSKEREPLGTGGALRMAIEYTCSNSVFVLNGDSYVRWQRDLLIAQHGEHKASATLWLARVEDKRRYGGVELDSCNKILKFKEKNNIAEAGLINAGIYLIRRSFIGQFPVAKKLSLEYDMLPFIAGKNLYAVVGEDFFIDIGTEESFANAERYLNKEFELNFKHSR